MDEDIYSSNFSPIICMIYLSRSILRRSVMTGFINRFRRFLILHIFTYRIVNLKKYSTCLNVDYTNSIRPNIIFLGVISLLCLKLYAILFEKNNNYPSSIFSSIV